MECRRVFFSRRAVERIFERGISPDEIKSGLDRGEVIAEFPEDVPLPSSLMLGLVENQPLHILVAFDYRDQTCIIITAYRPDPELWEPDYRTRKPR